MEKICDTARVSAYLDGELTAGERAAMETHIASCPHCALLLREFRQNDGAVRDAMTPAVDPPGLKHLETKVLHRISSPRRTIPWFARAAAVVVAVSTPVIFRIVAAIVYVAVLVIILRPHERLPVDVSQPPASVDHGGYVKVAPVAMTKAPDLSATVAGEAVMLNIVNGADADDLPLLQSAVATNAVRARIATLKESGDIDPATRRSLSQMETILIGLDNVESSDAQEHLQMIQSAINDNGLINACQEAKRRMGHAMD